MLWPGIVRFQLIFGGASPCCSIPTGPVPWFVLSRIDRQRSLLQFPPERPSSSRKNIDRWTLSSNPESLMNFEVSRVCSLSDHQPKNMNHSNSSASQQPKGLVTVCAQLIILMHVPSYRLASSHDDDLHLPRNPHPMKIQSAHLSGYKAPSKSPSSPGLPQLCLPRASSSSAPAPAATPTLEQSPSIPSVKSSESPNHSPGSAPTSANAMESRRIVGLS